MMKPSFILELLFVFILLAFAASESINKEIYDRQNPLNKVCTCTNIACNCCRDFSLNLFPFRESGCATLQYFNKNKVILTMSFGDRILSNSTIHLNKSPKPVCIRFPGGLTEFCGRVYGIDRDQQQFKACLGLELRSFHDIEASLKVSCFRFGPNGLKLEPNSKNSSVSKLSNKNKQVSKKKIVKANQEEEYEDDNDELFSFYDDNDINSDDVTAFSVVSDDFLGGLLFETDKKKVKVNSRLKSTYTVAPTTTHVLQLPKKPSLNQNSDKNTSLSIKSDSNTTKQAEFESVQPELQPQPQPQSQPQFQTELSILDKVNLLNKKYSMDNRIRSDKLSSNRRQTKEMLTYSMTDLKNLGVKFNLSTTH